MNQPRQARDYIKAPFHLINTIMLYDSAGIYARERETIIYNAWFKI